MDGYDPKELVDPRNWLGSAQAARMLGVTRRHLYRLMEAGAVRSGRGRGRKGTAHAFWREDIELLARERQARRRELFAWKFAESGRRPHRVPAGRLPVSEAAEALGVSRRTLERLASRGLVRRFKHGDLASFRRSEIEALTRDGWPGRRRRSTRAAP